MRIAAPCSHPTLSMENHQLYGMTRKVHLHAMRRWRLYYLLHGMLVHNIINNGVNPGAQNRTEQGGTHRKSTRTEKFQFLGIARQWCPCGRLRPLWCDYGEMCFLCLCVWVPMCDLWLMNGMKTSTAFSIIDCCVTTVDEAIQERPKRLVHSNNEIKNVCVSGKSIVSK